MSALPITPRQQQALDFVSSFSEENGYAPSVRELAEALGLASPSTAHRLLRILESKGKLRRQRVSRTREVYVAV